MCRAIAGGSGGASPGISTTTPPGRCRVDGIPIRCRMSIDPKVACRAAAEVRSVLLLLLLLLLLVLLGCVAGLIAAAVAFAGVPRGSILCPVVVVLGREVGCLTLGLLPLLLMGRRRSLLGTRLFPASMFRAATRRSN